MLIFDFLLVFCLVCILFGLHFVWFAFCLILQKKKEEKMAQK